MHATLDDGRFPTGGAKPAARWEGLDDTTIEALLRVPIDAARAEGFVRLPHIISGAARTWTTSRRPSSPIGRAARAAGTKTCGGVRRYIERARHGPLAAGLFRADRHVGASNRVETRRIPFALSGAILWRPASRTHITVAARTTRSTGESRRAAETTTVMAAIIAVEDCPSADFTEAVGGSRGAPALAGILADDDRLKPDNKRSRPPASW